MRVVIDASIALAWCFEDETDARAVDALKIVAEEKALVPAHWSLEVANALLMAERKGRTRAAETIRAITLLGALPIDFDTRTGEVAAKETLALARSYGLTIYDAAYLELCLREDLPLATLDADLLAGGRKAGATILKGL